MSDSVYHWGLFCQGNSLRFLIVPDDKSLRREDGFRASQNSLNSILPNAGKALGENNLACAVDFRLVCPYNVSIVYSMAVPAPGRNGSAFLEPFWAALRAPQFRKVTNSVESENVVPCA